MQLFKHQLRLSSSQVILFGFAIVILLSALLLMTPFASADHTWTPFLDALFTTTSAMCVTGLVVVDTAMHWSLFGQLIIMILIQIGGLGIVMAISAIAVLSGKKIGLMQRSTMADSISAPQLGGIVRLTKFILKMTFGIETLFALIMAFVFIPQFGLLRGIWYSIFHSVSAFCNAGFDLMGVQAPFSSLTSYIDNPLINLSVMALIVMGGLSFMTWYDIQQHGLHFHQYRMQSKLILVTTAILIVCPAIYFFFCEFEHFSFKTRILASLFQSITPRTAGFNTADYTAFSDNGRLLTIILMLIGGSPGSTAGGMKTTTFAIMILSSISIFKHKDRTECYGRTIPESIVRNAGTIFMMYIVLCLLGGTIISAMDGIDLLTAIFESASAVGTVGLTLGITPSLSTISHIVLILLMFIGRIGGLTLIYAFFTKTNKNTGRFIEESVVVG